MRREDFSFRLKLQGMICDSMTDGCLAVQIGNSNGRGKEKQMKVVVNGCVAAGLVMLSGCYTAQMTERLCSADSAVRIQAVQDIADGNTPKENIEFAWEKPLPHDEQLKNIALGVSINGKGAVNYSSDVRIKAAGYYVRGNFKTLFELIS